jgi:glycerol-1-phosphate dehydrogenase [NAD(P)+]
MQLLRYDPSEGDGFWSTIRKLPGFPHNENIPLKSILIESDALLKLPEILTDLTGIRSGEVLVVMDGTPMRRGPDELKRLALQILQENGWQPLPLVLLPDASGQVHTDMTHIEGVTRRIKVGTPVISIGSGVVTDVTKHACFLYEQDKGVHIPFVAFQTANSVTAYTSNMAPIFINGVKRTFPSRYPDVVVSDLETLGDAPREMTIAGVGDLLAAFVSLADWRLADALGMDQTYNELAYHLMDGLDQVLVAYAEDIRQGGPEGMSALAKLIHLAGLTMSLTHTTAPLSGYEHAIAHTLDLLNEKKGLPLPYHGSLVALAAVLSSKSYQDFLNEFDPRTVDIEAAFPPAESMRAQILDGFSLVDGTGKAGEACWSDYRIKLEKWSEQKSRLNSFLADWPQIRQELSSLAHPPESILDILRAVDAPLRFEELTPPVPRDSVQFAFLNAPLTRHRLTLGDLLIFLNWDRPVLWEKIWKQLSEKHQ